jgi:hypothetical protein
LLSNRSKATHLRLVSLALDARLEEQPQLVEIGGGELVEEVAVCHPGVGHSWIFLKVEHSKENPTVAFFVYPFSSGAAAEKASIPTTVCN